MLNQKYSPILVVKNHFPQKHLNFVGFWLLSCCLMVGFMILLGGATRLTESGLSIVDWNLFTGLLPPTNQNDWNALFSAYRTSPEFLKINFWMSVDDFKSIYWLEYLHRLWGRLIGLVFLLPFLYFLIRRKIGINLSWKLSGIFLLICLQGLLGWYMVKSGLIEEPYVSQYRLAAHLGLAFIIFGFLFWYSLKCLDHKRHRVKERWLHVSAFAIVSCIFITIIWGAFVAGLDAGLAYNTFPFMDGQIVPKDLLNLSPWWINFFENTAAVQFTHRLTAVGTVTFTILFFLFSLRTSIDAATSRSIKLLVILAVGQMALGVGTLLFEVAMPLALLHQFGALALFTSSIWVLYHLRY